MKDRCLNRSNISYHRYGGRGITVCKEWLDSFDAFNKYVGPKPSLHHSIGRIDNDGNYEPGNVEWQTSKQQGNNTSRCIFLEFNGKRLTKMQWAIELGIHYETFKERIARGLTGKALFTPNRESGKGHRRWITLHNETKTLKQWAADCGISPRTIRQRLDVKGWDAERALTTPVNPVWQRNGKQTKGLRP